MTMNYENLPGPVDPIWAGDCTRRVVPYLPPRAEVLAVKQKGPSTAVYINCTPALGEGATRRLASALQHDPAFKELFHFTQGREMAVYFTTPSGVKL